MDKQICQTIGYFEKKSDALEALAIYNKQPTEKLNITLSQLFNEWKEIKYRNISRDTKNNYNAAWLYLIKISEMKVKDIRTGNLQSIIDNPEKAELDKDGIAIRVDGKLKLTKCELSRSSLEKIKALCTQLFSYSIENDIVHKNYAEFLVLPKAEKSNKKAFTDIELKLIESSIGKVPYADCILMMCYTGFRITEFLTLTKFSYDPIKCTLTGGNKTEAGKNRIVPVKSKIKPLLEAWLKKDGQTIICREDGTPFSSKYFRENCFGPALQQIEGVRKLSPHECRHTFASLLHAAKVSQKNIMDLMGHDDPTIDAKTYIHVNIDDLINSVEAI